MRVRGVECKFSGWGVGTTFGFERREKVRVGVYGQGSGWGVGRRFGLERREKVRVGEWGEGSTGKG